MIIAHSNLNHLISYHWSLMSFVQYWSFYVPSVFHQGHSVSPSPAVQYWFYASVFPQGHSVSPSPAVPPAHSHAPSILGPCVIPYPPLVLPYVSRPVHVSPAGPTIPRTSCPHIAPSHVDTCEMEQLSLNLM
jgi:hypothetical protein